MRALIVGGGEVGAYLAQVLGAQGHTVSLIESDSKRATAISETTKAMVLLGDGTGDFAEQVPYLVGKHANLRAPKHAVYNGAGMKGEIDGNVARLRKPPRTDGLSLTRLQIHVGVGLANGGNVGIRRSSGIWIWWRDSDEGQ